MAAIATTGLAERYDGMTTVGDDCAGEDEKTNTGLRYGMTGQR